MSHVYSWVKYNLVLKLPQFIWMFSQNYQYFVLSKWTKIKSHGWHVTLLAQKSKNTPCTDGTFSDINLKSPTSPSSSISNPGLFLHDNNFFGDFPASIASLYRLKVVDLSGNEISGQIPDSLLRPQWLYWRRRSGCRGYALQPVTSKEQSRGEASLDVNLGGSESWTLGEHRKPSWGTGPRSTGHIYGGLSIFREVVHVG